jgi:hypothetical protein
MAYKYIGTVEDGDGRACQVRWDDVTGVIHVHVYHFPISEDPRWEWMTTRARAGTAGGALSIARVWLRGGAGSSPPQRGPLAHFL